VLKGVIDVSSGIQRRIGSHGHCMGSIKRECRGSCICRDGGDCPRRRCGGVGNTGRMRSGFHLSDLTIVVIRQAAKLQLVVCFGFL